MAKVKPVLYLLMTVWVLCSFGCNRSPIIGGPPDGEGQAGTRGTSAVPTGPGGNGGSVPMGGGGMTMATGGAGGAAGVPASGGASGATGAKPTDISGRWQMFAFEDPVGVQLVEAADGTLTGRGCASGAPGGPPPMVPELFCGGISGKVTGQMAWFMFGLGNQAMPPGPYSARVTISADGLRMAGVFNNGAGDLSYPMAWLRVREDAAGLEAAPNVPGTDPLFGAYELGLVADVSVGSEFVPGTSYVLQFFAHALTGDLGSFWHSEMSTRNQGSPMRVGPVSQTVPNLPTSLALEFDAAAFTRVTATTGSGGFYTFSARKMTAP